MIELKLILAVTCGVLFSLGGIHWLYCRRFIMPSVLAFEAAFIEWKNKDKKWWEGFVVLPVIAILCLAYKDFGSGKFSRGCWLFVVFAVPAAGLVLTGHLFWLYAIPYAIMGGVLGGLLISVWQPLGDFIYGFAFGLIGFLIH